MEWGSEIVKLLDQSEEELSKSLTPRLSRAHHSNKVKQVPDNEFGLSQCATIASLAALLRLHGSNKTLSHGMLAHSRLITHGYDQVTFLSNTLVAMYGNCGSILDAQAVFDRIHNPNLFSWNALINAYGQNGYVERAESVFDKTPNPDAYSWNLVIKAFRENDRLQDAQRVFLHMPYHDVVSWTAMIAAFAQAGHNKEALDLFYQMQTEGVKPDKRAFIRALDACVSVSSLEAGQKIHHNVSETSLDGDIVVGTALVSMYGRCQNVLDARIMFSKLDKPDTISWTALISLFVDNNLDKEALCAFYQMQLESVKPDDVTIACTLHTCSVAGMWEEGQEIHAAAVEDGHDQHGMMGSALVNFYGKCNHLHDATRVFKSMLVRTIATWNAFISIFVQNGCNEQALDVFAHMLLAGLEPDKLTFITLLGACADLAVLKLGQEIHSTIIDVGYDHVDAVAHSLVKMYGKCQSSSDARKVFESKTCHTVIDWNILVATFIWNGQEEEGLQSFWQMQQKGVMPNFVTFAYSLDACAMLEAYEQGQGIHAIIIEETGVLDVMLSTALITMYGKCGHLRDAAHIFATMADPDVIMWTAMIGLYMEHDQIEDALHLFQKMQLEAVGPDQMTFAIALDACGTVGALEDGQDIHSAVTMRGYDRDALVETALISMYGRSGNRQAARSVFNNVQYHTIDPWNAIISAYSHNGHGEDALSLFWEMQCQDVKPDGITFIALLKACSHAGLLDDGRSCFVSMSGDYGLRYMHEHYVCIIDLISRAGHLDEAEDIANSMPTENDSSAWLCLLNACRIHDNPSVAARVVNKCSGSDPDNYTPYLMLSNIFSASKTFDLRLLDLEDVEVG